MRRGIKKVEMIDAWTQTSNRGSDTEDNKKRDARKKELEQGNRPRASLENIYNSKIGKSHQQ